MEKHLGENKGVEVKAGNFMATGSGKAQPQPVNPWRDVEREGGGHKDRLRCLQRKAFYGWEGDQQDDTAVKVDYNEIEAK